MTSSARFRNDARARGLGRCVAVRDEEVWLGARSSVAAPGSMLHSGPAVYLEGDRRLAPGSALRPAPENALPRLSNPSELLERCRQRDESAWAELVLHYESLVFSTALNAGLDHDAAVDVLQQVWLEFYRSLLRIREPGAVTKWLITTTRRIAYRHAILNNRWVHEIREDMAGESPAADEAIETLERRQELEAAFAALDPKCSEILRMLFLSNDKVSYAEVSQATGLAENSIGPVRARCLERLRVILGGER